MTHTKVVHEVGFGHTNTSVDEGESLLLLVGDKADVELGSTLQFALVSEGFITNLVQSL